MSRLYLETISTIDLENKSYCPKYKMGFNACYDQWVRFMPSEKEIKNIVSVSTCHALEYQLDIGDVISEAILKRMNGE